MLHHFLGAKFTTFDSFPFPVEVISSNLENSSTNVHTGPAAVVDSVMASAGLPYLFRVKSPVDGGLCENLPVEKMLRDEDKFGPVVAISFAKSAPQIPDSIWKFTLALLDTAITNSVERSKALLPKPLVLEIETEATTFDFEFALDTKKGGLGEDYNRVKQQATNFFQNVSSFLDLRSFVAPPHWETTDRSAALVMENSYLAYRKAQAQEPVDPIKISFSVIARRALGSGHPLYGLDEVRYQFDFRALNRVSCMAIGIAAPPGTPYLALSDWLIKSTKGIVRKKKDMIPVPVRDPKSPLTRMIVFYFDPLEQGEYQFQFTDFGEDYMKALSQSQEDEVSFETWKNGKATPVVDLILQVHERFRPLAFTSEMHRLDEVEEYHVPSFTAYGFRAQDVAPGTTVQFKVQ